MPELKYQGLFRKAAMILLARMRKLAREVNKTKRRMLFSQYAVFIKVKARLNASDE